MQRGSIVLDAVDRIQRALAVVIVEGQLLRSMKQLRSKNQRQFLARLGPQERKAESEAVSQYADDDEERSCRDQHRGLGSGGRQRRC